MSGSNRKGGSKQRSKRSLGEKFADVTLYDFANSSSHGARLKKSSTNAIVREVKELCSNGTESDIAWYDKSLDDFDVDTIRGEKAKADHPEDCDITKSIHTKPSQKEEDFPDDKYFHWPLDVWFLISMYILPEDISTFARICRNTNYVVHSPNFWFNLYKRHYTEEVNLPQRLQPDCMERPHSLKACVVRALFLMYPPFIERVRSSAPFQSEPHGLISKQCVLMWHRKKRSVWDFCFKFYSRNPASNKNCVSSAKRPDLLEMLEDVHANTEDGFKVLQITCLNFVSTPAVMGMYLAAVNLNVGHKMLHHKLRLTFSSTSYRHSIRNQDAGNLTFTFDPVSNIRVLDWWHPHYPIYDP